tara:strand:- start:1350 stop:2210 length:861 start_codon:yes stop_codon:yes gene_type:complete
MKRLSEMMAGDGSGLALPPAFVFVNTKSARKYKKGNSKIDGRSKDAKDLMSRIQRRKMNKEELETTNEASLATARKNIGRNPKKKSCWDGYKATGTKMKGGKSVPDCKKEELETPIAESVPNETERAQKQIGQMKKLNRRKELQKKRGEAKQKMQSKTKEMDILMKARLSDFKKKAGSQTKKLKTLNNSIELKGDDMIKETTLSQKDALEVAVAVATKEVPDFGENDMAKIQFSDGGIQNLDNFSAKKIAACYGSLDDSHKDQFRFMVNKDAATFQSALDFAIRNV